MGPSQCTYWDQFFRTRGIESIKYLYIKYRVIFLCIFETVDSVQKESVFNFFTLNLSQIMSDYSDLYNITIYIIINI